jgi:hypothetical protein
MTTMLLISAGIALLAFGALAVAVVAIDIAGKPG